MHTILEKIGSAILGVGIFISSLFAPVQAPNDNLGAAIPVVVSTFQTSLQASITASATSMTLVNGTDASGDALSGYICFNVDEGTSLEEFVCGTVSGTAVTGMSRGIDPVDGDLEVTALKKTHRRGASVKITDYPTLGIISRILNGAETLPNALTYTSGVGPVASGDLADKEYVLSVVSGGTVTTDKVITTGTAGETVAAGNLVYKSTDSRWYKTDADTASTVENVELGIAQGSGTSGNAISGGVLRSGVDTNQSGLSANTVYYASNTAGALSSTVGTKEVTIGRAVSTTSIDFSPRYNQQITEDEQDAIAGSSGTPSSSNKFITQDNTSSNSNDQSQTTQDSSYATGEADATTKKNLIAQSFIPTKSKIRGVKLYKAADTGTFAGTIDISIQADSSGSPSGTPLVTRTLTLLEYRAFAVGEFEAYFTSEYTSLTPGSLYWIVIDPSTSDNSNHPNLGYNTAGGYSSGTLKYKNTTNGWTLESGADLYFRTVEGLFNQVSLLDAAGKFVSSLFDPAKMPIPAFQQDIPIRNTTTSGAPLQITSSMDGSVVFASTSGTDDLHRYARDSVTGMYFDTHTVNGSLSSTPRPGMAVLGDYLYVFYDAGANIDCYRYLAADLTGEQDMTFGTAITAGGSNSATQAWTDGQFLYVVGADSTTNVTKLSVSGTNFTQVSVGTLGAVLDNQAFLHAMNDGTNVFGTFISDPTITIYKFSDIDGQAAPTSTTTKVVPDFSNIGQTQVGLVNIDKTRMYLVVGRSEYSEAAQTTNFLMFIPFTKP